jgi:Putative addiction module component
MTATARQLLQQALELDETDRASVAGLLLESLHGPADDGAEALWDAEVRRRIDEIDRGTVELVPWGEVRQRLFRGFE